jgi:UV DNA damage endonuclease
MFRLGVAVRILGAGGLRARDGRRAEHAPHLSVSLLLVREVLLYLAQQRIGCYRLADDLAPYLTDPRRPAFAHQVDECGELLAEVGALARRHGIRLTMHLPLHVTLSAPDHAIALRSQAEIAARARLLDALGCGLEGVLVLHIGGAHGDRAAALERFAARYEQLPVSARRRVVVEPDEDCFGLPELLRLHQLTGAPVVFDMLHHQINNREQIALGAALGLALATWPRGVPPKVHFSSQRTEAHRLPAQRGQQQRVLAPQLGQHADFINPFEFVQFMNAAAGQSPFDIMLEAKAADLALARLRDDLARLAPALVERVC